MNENEKKIDMKKQIEQLKKKYLNKGNNRGSEIKQNEQKKQQVKKKEQIKKQNDSLKIIKQQKQKFNKQKIKNNIKDSQLLLKIFQKQKTSYKKEQQKQIQNHVYKKDPFKLGLYDLSMIPSQNNIINQNKIQSNNQPQINNIQQQQPITSQFPQLSQKQLCQKWLQNPQQVVRYIYNLKQDKKIQPQLKSNNRLFPGLMQQMVRVFIVNSNRVLNEQQKQLVYRVGIQYFSPSPKYLSDILLICLIKIGDKYCCIYYEQIIKKIQFYSKKIYKYRQYFLKQQLTQFLSNLLKQKHINNDVGDKLVWLLGLQSDLNVIHQALITQNLGDRKLLLNILCILQPKTIPLSLLYLKCVNQLIPLFKQLGVLQKVINNFKSIKIPQQLYQSAKSLKLKLITSADNQADKKQNDQLKGGFMDYFNKTVTKIKGINDKSNQ